MDVFLLPRDLYLAQDPSGNKEGEGPDFRALPAHLTPPSMFPAAKDRATCILLGEQRSLNSLEVLNLVFILECPEQSLYL